MAKKKEIGPYDPSKSYKPTKAEVRRVEAAWRKKKRQQNPGWIPARAVRIKRNKRGQATAIQIQRP